MCAPLIGERRKNLIFPRGKHRVGRLSAAIVSHESCGGVGSIEGRWTMTRTDMIAIRRRLRDVNIEYSGLVRNKLGESRFVRMEELKAERETLVGLIVQNEKSGLLGVSSAIAPETSRHAAH
jgi:hypothetical protein